MLYMHHHFMDIWSNSDNSNRYIQFFIDLLLFAIKRLHYESLSAFSGLDECPGLTGTAVFCYLIASLALCLGLLCCCYHWVRTDEDLPHALFCVAYCLLLLFIFTSVAGTTSVFTHYETISNGTQYDSHNHTAVSCGMTHLPVGVLILSYVLGTFLVVMSYVACVLALGATSDIEW